jgi:hypothetical protein
MGVDHEKLDAAKDTRTIVALIVEKMRAEGRRSIQQLADQPLR